jgi:hypothetical protein
MSSYMVQAMDSSRYALQSSIAQPPGGTTNCGVGFSPPNNYLTGGDSVYGATTTNPYTGPVADPTPVSSIQTRRSVFHYCSGYRIPPHGHPSRENATVISGKFKVGMGDTFDESKMSTFGAASFGYLEPSNASKGDHSLSQNHFTLSIPLKSSADAKAIVEQLPPLIPEFLKVEDTIGTIHSSRFTVLNENTLIFIGDFDGELGERMAELAKLVSGLFFYLCFKMQERATSYYEQLSQLQKRYVAAGRSLRKQKLFFATCHGK